MNVNDVKATEKQNNRTTSNAKYTHTHLFAAIDMQNMSKFFCYVPSKGSRQNTKKRDFYMFIIKSDKFVVAFSESKPIWIWQTLNYQTFQCATSFPFSVRSFSPAFLAIALALLQYKCTQQKKWFAPHFPLASQFPSIIIAIGTGDYNFSLMIMISCIAFSSIFMKPQA